MFPPGKLFTPSLHSQEVRDGVGRYVCSCVHKLRNTWSWFICSLRRSTTKTFKSAPWKFFNETLSSWGQEWYQFLYLQHCAWHVVKGCVWREGAGRERDRDRDWLRVTHQGGKVPRGLPLAKLKSQAAFSPLEVLWAWKINLIWA